MKEFKCEVCDKNFKYLSLYERHKRIHNNERTFKCEICDKTFNRPDTLKTHMNIHTGQGFQCCGRFFHSKAALKYHQRSSHSVTVIKCKECDQTFENEQKLEAHLQTHIVTQFPMLFDCATTEESNNELEEPAQKLILVGDVGKNYSIWSEADLLLSYLKV